MAVRRGALIVLEGCDRTGKSTQIKLLRDYLTSRGKEVEVIGFPDRSTLIGGIINDYLKGSDQDDRALHLLFAANRWERQVIVGDGSRRSFLCGVLRVDARGMLPYLLLTYALGSRQYIRETLNRGATLLVDRYSFSGVAYTAAKGLPLDFCLRSEIGMVKPDLVLYLDIPIAVAAGRVGYGAERYERVDFQQRVADAYSMIKGDYWKTVNVNRPIDAVQSDIQAICDLFFSTVELDDVGFL